MSVVKDLSKKTKIELCNLYKERGMTISKLKEISRERKFDDFNVLQKSDISYAIKSAISKRLIRHELAVTLVEKFIYARMQHIGYYSDFIRQQYESLLDAYGDVYQNEDLIKLGDLENTIYKDPLIQTKISKLKGLAFNLDSYKSYSYDGSPTKEELKKEIDKTIEDINFLLYCLNLDFDKAV